MNTLKITFTIDGMHCSACAMNIDFDLEDLKGVKSAKTNYAKQLTMVEFDEALIKAEDIIQTIKKAGYKATLLESH